MKDQLPKFRPKTSKALRNATSSPESEAGLSHSSSQASRQQPDSGQARRRASRSALPENNLDNSTPDTSHPYSSTSSASAALQSCLGNKLRQQLQNRGCAIYKLTWKEKATPSGLPYSQLVASARRTNAIDSSLARTNWPTPCANNGTGAGTSGREGGLNLQTAATFSSWATTTVRDHKSGAANLENSLFRKDGKLRNDLVDYQAYLAAWPSPTANSNDRSPNPENAMNMHRADGSKIQQRLQDFAAIAQPVRITAAGQMLTGSAAGMDVLGQLNPAHSRWLMGFPPEWDDCAVTAMQSSRKSPPNSSKHSWRPKPKLWFKIS